MFYFNGEIAFIHYCVHTDDGLIYRKYYDKKWCETDFYLGYKVKSEYVPDLINREKVILYSKKLSKNFKFVRVDFFEVNEELYFAEMTFTPFSGDIQIMLENYDLCLGYMLKI